MSKADEKAGSKKVKPDRAHRFVDTDLDGLTLGKKKAPEKEKAVSVDLRKWRKVALKAVASGRPQRAFKSSVIPPEVHAALTEWMPTVLCAEDVDWSFRALAKARRPVISVRRRLRLERSFREVLSSHFAERAPDAAKAAVSEFKALSKAAEEPDVISAALRWDVLVEDLTPELAKAFLEGEEIAGDAHGVFIDFALTDEQAQAYAKERAAELVGKHVNPDGTVVEAVDKSYAISETVREDLRATITKALEQGWTEAELQEEIEDSGFWNWRADRIARTEVAVALNKGTAATYGEAGVSTVTIIDGHGCLADGHDDAVAGVDGEIWSLEKFIEYPVGHPNCIRDAVANLPEGA